MKKHIVILLFAALVVVAVLFGRSASAQMPGIDLPIDGSRHLTPEEKEKFKEIDQKYKSTMEKVPDKKQAYDPWAKNSARTIEKARPTLKRLGLRLRTATRTSDGRFQDGLGTLRLSGRRPARAELGANNARAFTFEHAAKTRPSRVPNGPDVGVQFRPEVLLQRLGSGDV